MPLTCVLENEDGESLIEINDPGNLFHRLLPEHDNEQFHCLRFIDWYGDTVFNRLHMERFLFEWQQIKKDARTEEERGLLDEVEELARKCKEGVHLYLKFYGD